MIEFQGQDKKDKNLWERINPCTLKKRELSCPEINNLSTYLEGRASKREVRAIEEHLISCSVCLDTLIELRGILREKPINPPVEFIERAKSLVAPSISREQQFFTRHSLWPKSPYPYLRKSLGWIALATFIIVVYIAGIRLGQDTSLNHQMISSSVLSEMSFGLIDSGGAL